MSFVERNNILKMCGEIGCEVKIVPSITDLAQDTNILHQVKDIKIEETLRSNI